MGICHYDQLTARTEKVIKKLVKKAQKHRSKTRLAEVNEQAFGAYLLWVELTQGDQKDDDSDRLYQLTIVKSTNVRL